MRMFVAGPVSLIINVLIVAGLSNLNPREDTGDEAPPERIPLTVVDRPPPPPPPEPEPVEDSTPLDTSAAAPAELPPLDVPPIASDGAGVSLPQADGAIDWDGLIERPKYTAQPREDDHKAGFELSAPVLLYQPDLASFYPRRAKQAGITGRTVLALELDARGAIAGLKILASNPQGVFDRAARRAAKKLRYKPALRNGRPQATTVRVELVWRLD